MAGFTVSADQYYTITGQLFELGRLARQKDGCPYEPDRLIRHLQNGIEGRGLPELSVSPPPTPPPCTTAVRSGTVLPGHVEFDAETLFLGDNPKLKVYDRGSNFKALVKGLKEQNVPAGTMSVRRTTRPCGGSEVVEEVSGTWHDLHFADIASVIDTLEKDGRWYVAKIGEWLVYFSWNDGLNRQGWYFHADRPVEFGFDEGNRVLLRDSVPAPSAA